MHTKLQNLRTYIETLLQCKLQSYLLLEVSWYILVCVLYSLAFRYWFGVSGLVGSLLFMSLLMGECHWLVVDWVNLPFKRLGIRLWFLSFGILVLSELYSYMCPLVVVGMKQHRGKIMTFILLNHFNMIFFDTIAWFTNTLSNQYWLL